MKNLSGRSHNILNIRAIMDDAKCFGTVRELRWWPEGIRCTHCQSDKVVEHSTGICMFKVFVMEYILTFFFRKYSREFKSQVQQLD